MRHNQENRFDTLADAGRAVRYSKGNGHGMHLSDSQTIVEATDVQFIEMKASPSEELVIENLV